MPGTINPAVPRLIRLAGFVDFVLAVVFIATPFLRGRIGDTLAYLVAAFLLVGSGATFWVARRMDAQLAAAANPAPVSTAGA